MDKAQFLTVKDDFDRRRYFWFPRDLVKNGLWATWPSAAQAVFPALLSFMGGGGSCFPSLDIIGIRCGRSRKTVSEGVDHLLNQPIPLTRTARITAAGRRSYVYRWPRPTVKRGLFFPLRHCIFDGGNWATLTPTAQAIYICMRTFGLVSGADELDAVFGGQSADAVEYGLRDFEFCRADPDVLCELSGITHRSLHAALDSLTRCGLAVRDPDMDGGDGADTWRVYLTPNKGNVTVTLR
ncbi:MAG: hypothetical protein EOM69_11430 [Clostridia bacterium]|nr:hypothetical protein [Clostridia bacterium]